MQVAVLERRAFVVERVGELRARLDVDDQRRAALHQRDLRAARMQVLRDVVAAVAGADDQRALALPVPRRRRYWLECSTVPAKFFSDGMSGMLGMPLTPVAITTWRGRIVARRAVGAAQRDGPAAVASRRSVPPSNSVPVQ